MPPLTRPESIHSWWSDSNSRGATISLHAIAKPLMRLMYHQQALQFMKKNRNIPLTSANIEIYLSYLEYKYVGASTKTKVLECIAKKPIREDDADAVAHSILARSNALDLFLQASDAQMQIYACDVLVNLALNTSSAPVILSLNPCGRLVSLLRGKNPALIVRALDVLQRIARGREGGEAVIQAGTLDLVHELFRSADRKVQLGTCRILSTLAVGRDTSTAVIRANTPEALVSLLRGADIASWVEGAKAVIDARILDHLEDVWELIPDQSVTCLMLENLADHESTRGFVLKANPWHHLVALLTDEFTAWCASLALRSILQSDEGVEAVLAAGILNVLDNLLDSSDSGAREEACALMADLAKYESVAPVIWQQGRCQKLMRLLRDDWPSVAAGAMEALSKIAWWPDGAAAVVDAGILDLLDEIRVFDSPVTRLCSWTCIMLEWLACHKSTACALLECNACWKLVALLRSDSANTKSCITIGKSDREVTRAELALIALESIAQVDEGPRVIVEAGTLHVLGELLGSSNSGVRQEACRLLDILAFDDSTSDAVLDMNPCRRLVSLLLSETSDENAATATLDALSSIARSFDGAQAVIEAGVLPVLDELLESPHPFVRTLSCNMMGKLARLQLTVPSIWHGRRCKMLVQLLRGDPPAAAAGEAVYVLSRIVDSADGALAVIEAGALHILDKLVQSSTPDVHRWIAVMLVTLVRHLCTTVAVLEVNPSPRLVKLLRGKHHDAIGPAAHALSSISKTLEGAQAVLDGGANGILDQLLESSNTCVRRWSCKILGNLARLQPPVPTLWTRRRCKMLVQLSRDAPAVDAKALYALSKIAHWAEGAMALIEAGVVHILNENVESRSWWAVELLIMFACHPSSTAAVLVANPCLSFVALLLSGKHLDVRLKSASYALARISESAEGAQAVLDGGANSILDRLLESSDIGVQMWSCHMLGNLARLQPTGPTLWTGSRCKMLVQLSRDGVPAVADRALYALSEGAMAVIKAGAVHVKSAIPGVHMMLAALFCLPCSTAAVLGVNPCPSLMALLRDEHPDGVELASCAMVYISESFQGAQAVVEAGANSIMNQLLESSNTNVQRWTCCLLRNLARYECTAPAVWQRNRCQKLIELLHDNKAEIADNAMFALSHVAWWVEGAAALVEAGVLRLLNETNKSAVLRMHKWTCAMPVPVLANLARHPSTAAAILAVHPSASLVTLLQFSDTELEITTVEGALRALASIAQSVNGSKAVIEAGILPLLSALLESSDSRVRECTCILVGNFALHESTAHVAWKDKHCQRLLELSCEHVAGPAAYALSTIAYWAEGAAAVIEAGVLHTLDKYFESALPIPDVHWWIGRMLGHLVSHPSTAAAVKEANLCSRLVISLQSESPAVIWLASRALSCISESEQGARAVFEGGVNNIIDQLLQSSDTQGDSSLMWSCRMLANMARFQPPIPALWDEIRCKMLVKLSRDNVPAVADRAVVALANIAAWADGAAAVIEAGALEFLDDLMQYVDVHILVGTCLMLRNIVHHKSTSAAVLATNPCSKLVRLLRTEPPDVIAAAAHTLAKISRAAAGAQAALEAGILGLLDTLLAHPREDVRGFTSKILAHLACFESCVDAILDAKACQKLASLLRDPNVHVQANSILALADLCKWPRTATAIAHTDLLDHVSQLMESPHQPVQLNVCIILSRLPRGKPAADLPY